MRPAPGLPTGTVTFLFTDIEGSTRLLQRLGDEYPALLSEHVQALGLREGVNETPADRLAEHLREPRRSIRPSCKPRSTRVWP